VPVNSWRPEGWRALQHSSEARGDHMGEAFTD
jgi:hypothetical protein